MGSLEGVLAGSHYNRAWVIHDAFSESLERLLFRRFLFEEKPRIPAILRRTNLKIQELDDKSVGSLNSIIDKSVSYRKRDRKNSSILDDIS